MYLYIFIKNRLNHYLIQGLRTFQIYQNGGVDQDVI